MTRDVACVVADVQFHAQFVLGDGGLPQTRWKFMRLMIFTRNMAPACITTGRIIHAIANHRFQLSLLRLRMTRVPHAFHEPSYELLRADHAIARAERQTAPLRPRHLPGAGHSAGD